MKNWQRALAAGVSLAGGAAFVYWLLSRKNDFRAARYVPYSPRARDLFRYAAKEAGVPSVWADDPNLHYILQRESGGYVGKPNYTFGGVTQNRYASQWPALWARLRRGDVWTKSTATGLGQLLTSNVKAFYPDGLDGIGDPVNEAVGFLRYIRRRYGTPAVARAVYGKKTNYVHGMPPGPSPWCKGQNRSQCRKGFAEGY